jgi:hypothetical protein
VHSTFSGLTSGWVHSEVEIVGLHKQSKAVSDLALPIRCLKVCISLQVNAAPVPTPPLRLWRIFGLIQPTRPHVRIDNGDNFCSIPNYEPEALEFRRAASFFGTEELVGTRLRTRCPIGSRATGAGE